MAILYGFGKSRERARKQLTRVAKELRKTLSRKPALFDLLSGEPLSSSKLKQRENKKQLGAQLEQLADSMPQSDSSSQSGSLSAAQELSRALEQIRTKVFQMSMSDIYSLLGEVLSAVGDLLRKFLVTFDESVLRAEPVALLALGAGAGASGSLAPAAAIAPALHLPMLESLKMLLDLFNRVRHTSGLLSLLESLLQFTQQLGEAATRAAHHWSQMAPQDAPTPAWLLNLHSYNTHLAVVLVAVARPVLLLVLLNPALSSLLFEACVAALPEQLLVAVLSSATSSKSLECSASERVVLGFLCYLLNNYPAHFARHVAYSCNS